VRKILLVEDQDTTVRDLKRNLESDGYTVYVTHFGREAPEMIARHLVDLVLLDLVLPDSKGLDLGRELRSKFPDLPIIVVSKITDSDEKVRAFQLYADDYVPKPYHIDELLERVRVQFDHIEHRHPGSVPRKIIVGPLEVNVKQRLVKVNAQTIELARKEFELLRLFVQNLGILLTYDYLLTGVWGDEAESERRYIHVYVNRLRKKIEIPAGCHFIHNEPNIGYRFELSD
jgi:DNA-binding response OmpR family regulator